MAVRQRAIKLFQLGIASDAEVSPLLQIMIVQLPEPLTLTIARQVRLLADYIEKIDAIVNKTTHVFISYRVAGEGQETRSLLGHELTAALFCSLTCSPPRVPLTARTLPCDHQPMPLSRSSCTRSSQPKPSRQLAKRCACTSMSRGWRTGKGGYQAF